jgi:signal transduction histidine kinase/HPt (histidine-containing phosphotransfer) domain-containing protein
VADATDKVPTPEQEEYALLQGRVAVLFRLARYDLSFPFAALCVASALLQPNVNYALVGVPVAAYLGATIYGRSLKRAYDKRGAYDDPAIWARRYTIFSGIVGAAWGLGAFLWLAAASFTAETYLVLAFLGMSAAEFVARSAYRPAYLAHAIPSLGSLALALALEGDQTLSAIIVLFFGGVLYSYGGKIGELLEESIVLRRDNAHLIVRLNEEKTAAETTRDHAQAGERAKSAFISNISQELRTPLNAILGMAQLLERSELEKAQRDHVKILLEAGRGLKTLLDDIIALANHTDDTMAVPLEGCDAAQAARTVARLLQPNAWEKRLRLSVNVAAGLPRVACDPRLLRRVLLKIAGNAIRFTDRGNVEIALDVKRDPSGRSCVRVAVTDTGPGIPAHMQSAIFDPFTRLDADPEASHGAGVGLTVAKRLVESVGGSIGVDSEPGMGARFWVMIPITEAPAATAPDNIESAAPPISLQLLVLARDPTMRSAVDRMLTPFGNRLTFADNLGQASTISARNSFDAILSTAGHVDSLSATPGHRTPILALAAWDERPPTGASHVLRWPASADALYTAIATVIGERNAKAKGHAKPEKPEAVLDVRAIGELEKSLGLKTLLDILQSYMQTAESLAKSVTAASDRGDWAQAARLAQDFAGMAGGLGLTEMTTAARTLAQGTRDGAANDILAKAARDILDEHRRVADGLRKLYPDLPAESPTADAA